jgi:predicted DCC family thiol-disulfide oxidoreductase YuxK
MSAKRMNDAGDDRYTLLYDHECPFCRLEVEWLLKRRGNRLAAVDIAAADFDPSVYGLTQHAVEAELHGVRPDGTVTVGMESVRASYTAAGVGWLMAWTAWPVLRWLSDLGYRIFARYRVPLGRVFGRSCDTGACELPASRRTTGAPEG